MALNPMVVSFGEHLERSMGKKLDLVSTTMQHNSSKLNMVQGLDEEILMPIEELVSQVTSPVAAAQPLRRPAFFSRVLLPFPCLTLSHVFHTLLLFRHLLAPLIARATWDASRFPSSIAAQLV